MSKVSMLAKKLHSMGNRAISEKFAWAPIRPWEQCQPHVKEAFGAIAKWHLSEVAAAAKKVRRPAGA